MARCPWAKSELSIAYHDQEWGTPVHDDRRLFEFLVLEGAQAGLSWETILKKRARYREVFHGFDIDRVARFTPRMVDTLLADPGIIRHRGKIESAIANARAAQRVRDEAGSLDRCLWGLVGGAPLVNRWRAHTDIPSKTPVAEAMSKALRAQGFSFVGPTICYAFMQAVGMVNDHLVDCPRHADCIQRST
ncbi:MAG TPA: DNA-3-methyladenine glycosylase I [Phycisphaerales bacterium]|nr:DNA-3-methyladenine glycosylase I [Phycisphaerales bacterium]